MKKRILTLLLALLLLAGLLPATALAAEYRESAAKKGPFLSAETDIPTEIYVNPLYANVITEKDIEDYAASIEASAQLTSVVYGDETYYTFDEAAAVLRAELVKRSTSITVNVVADSTSISGTLFKASLAETDKTNEGDYLRWQYGGYRSGGSYYPSGDGLYYITYTYTVSYYTTAAEELAVDERLAELYNELGLTDESSDLNKIRTIYSYITTNVRYDVANLENPNYKYKYTAYAALFNGTAVCQGYALLMYRMCRDNGIPSRVIAGIGNGGDHGWNIVAYEGLFYLCDATWDERAGGGTYHYFLRGTEDFDTVAGNSHSAFNADYCTDEFKAQYPISPVHFAVPEHAHTDADKDNICDVPGCWQELYVERSFNGTKTVETLRAFPQSYSEIRTDRTLEEGYTYIFDPGQWYVISGENVIYNALITILGTADEPVSFILKDGAKLTVNGGILLKDDCVLHIYGQSGDSGELVTIGSKYDPSGIGWGGSLTVHGGRISATCSPEYTDYGGIDGSFTMYGGCVDAIGGTNAGGVKGDISINCEALITAGSSAQTAQETTVEDYRTSRAVYFHAERLLPSATLSFVQPGHPHASFPTVEPIELTSGGAVLPAPDFVPDEVNGWQYIFLGWSADGGVTLLPSGTFFSPEEDVTFTAVWRLATLTGDRCWGFRDAMSIMDHIDNSKDFTFCEEQLAIANCDGDRRGTINYRDAMAIMNYANGKTEGFAFPLDNP